jgi:hypothetical protein
LWYTKEAVVYQRVDKNITVIESISLDRTVVKYKIWNSEDEARQLDPRETDFILGIKVDSPWLWVGADTLSGTTDMTIYFDGYLVPGNTITPSLLNARYPLYHNWRYLDSVTFKEVDFPDAGITIDAPGVERPTKESQEDKDTR